MLAYSAAARDVHAHASIPAQAREAAVLFGVLAFGPGIEIRLEPTRGFKKACYVNKIPSLTEFSSG